MASSVYGLRLVLNTGFIMTCLTPVARDGLIAFGLLRRGDDRYPVLHELSIGGRPLPPLPVRVNQAVARYSPDGMLGLNLLSLFREIHFDVETRRLTLTF
jgi:hypothetical protein